jgi:hypothetical protein
MRFSSSAPSAIKKLPVFLLPVLFLAVVPAILGKDFWEKKEYKEWSEKDCRKMLQNSPWSKDYTLQDVQIMSNDRTRSNEQQPFVKYQVQLRSALPVRQAMVRMMAIAQKYDDLAPEQKQQFDKSAESFLAQDLSQAVVVYVTYATNSQPIDLELARHWQSQTVDLLKNEVFLRGSKGDQVPLAQFAAAQGGERAFQFIFPRQVNGQEILSPNDKELKLEFPYPRAGSIAAGKAFLEFKTKKMQIDGKLMY